LPIGKLSPLLIYSLIKKSNNRLLICPAGGITEKNIHNIVEICRPRQFHVSGKVKKLSKMKWKNENVHMGSNENDEFSYYIADPFRLKNFFYCM